MSRGNYPAFPARVFEPMGDNSDHGGMTVREHLAGLAMQGLLAAHGEGWVTLERIAAVVGADPHAYLEKAVEALPEPKAWAKLRAAAETEAGA